MLFGWAGYFEYTALEAAHKMKGSTSFRLQVVQDLLDNEACCKRLYRV